MQWLFIFATERRLLLDNLLLEVFEASAITPYKKVQNDSINGWELMLNEFININLQDKSIRSQSPFTSYQDETRPLTFHTKAKQ